MPQRRHAARRADRPVSNGWTTGQVAFHIGTSDDFVLSEIRDGALRAAKFGREWRIAYAEVRRYCSSKGYELPEPLAS
jgi:excisionase family DNA binding protein